LGGWVENLMMRFVDVMFALPYIFVVIIVMTMIPEEKLDGDTYIYILFFVLGAVQWLVMARIVRGQVLSLKKREFVEAARAIGVSNSKIIFRHLIPNTLGPIIVYTTLTVPAVMLEEAFLSFIGLGVRPPKASWGTLLSEGANEMVVHPWLLIFPAVFMSLTLFSLNFLGDGLRDALDPQLRKD
jgi:oligopeptide transport system permease protein